ncbi:hypothetical protein [Capnocytophaga gingivalis]
MTNKIIIIDLEATCWEGIPPKKEKSAKLPLVGTHHRGKDDAYNIAKIMYKLVTNPLEQN